MHCLKIVKIAISIIWLTSCDKSFMDISALSNMNIHGIIKSVEISGNQDAINSVVLKKII